LKCERYLLAQRALAAILAIADRRLALSFAALAFPPLEPPNFPSATAAGFLLRGGFDTAELCHSSRYPVGGLVAAGPDRPDWPRR
jgi:hypothetical protein